MLKLIPNVNENHSPVLLSFRVLSDGSLLVKKGSSTIIKSNSWALVKGSLIKDFKDDVTEDIGLVQKCFTTWMSEIRSKYKGSVKPSYHDESVLITSIKYTKVVKTLVVASLSDKVEKSSSPLNAGSNDTVSPSESDTLESKALRPVTQKMQSRLYSTAASLPYVKIIKPPKVSGVCLYSRMPSLLKLERSSNGSFKFNLDGINLLHSQRLKEVLDSISEKIKEVESINAKGYVNTTSLSNYPVLCNYLDAYVLCKKLEVADPDGVMSTVERLKIIDSTLTLREKRVLIIWFYSLLNLNMYYLILDVLYRLGVGLSNARANEWLEGTLLPEEEKLLIADLIVDLKTYANKLWMNINPSVRESLRQRGITVTENIYCGYDTEYKNLDMNKNQILSAQWAVNSKMVLTLPYISDYDLSGQNTLTGEIYPQNSMWFKQEKLRFEPLQDEIRDFISKIRMLRYSSNDESIKSITKGLIDKGIPYFIDNGKINFSFPRTPIKTYFKSADLDKLSLSKLVQIGINLESKEMDSSREGLYSLLKELNQENQDSKDEIPESNFVNLVHPDGTNTEIIDSSLESLKPRKYKGSSSRTYKGGFTSEAISLTTRRNFYIIGHLTQADLSFLSDFEEVKSSLDIVNKCMVTLGKSDIKRYGHNIIFRDTLLLAPGGKQSLSAIGGMYGDNLRKIALSASQYQKMDVLMKEDPTLFKSYALRDSLISLVHASVLEDNNFKLNKLGIPLTLSSLGVSNLRNSWKTQDYKGYQISRDYLLGDSRKLPTPKGLFAVGNVGLFMNNYIANYKGGRNESYMIGRDTKTHWYDYDLTAAYTTAMCMLGDPNYELARRISPAEIKLMSDNELLYSYTTIEVKNYSFPDRLLYPSIPCYSDETTTVYPLTGKAVLTGSEYITAKTQGCQMELVGGTLIPYKLKTEKSKLVVSHDAYEDWRIIWEGYKKVAFPDSVEWDQPLDEIFKDMPFRKIIYDLQSERRKHPKGTIDNLLYKEMGNSLYGSVTKGINHKVKFDIKTNKTVRMEASDISNPILASWITAYVRSVIGELLQNVQDLGGKVVSVTTDGFITDLADLESRILNTQSEEPKRFNPTLEGLEKLTGFDEEGNIIQLDLLDGGKIGKGCIVFPKKLSTESLKLSLLKEYKKTREFLSGDPTCLELKHDGVGVMSWTTRGQISLDMGLKAITGLQTRDMDLTESFELMSEAGLGNTIGFTSTSLRSAIDIYKKGGHVTMGYSERDFRILYNNNRVVVDFLENNDEGGLLRTMPVKSVEESLTQRSFSRLTIGSVYQKNTSIKTISKYRCNLELGVRAFIKDVVNNRNGVNLSMFKGYTGILDFIRKYLYESGEDFKWNLDSSYVSQVKLRSLGKYQKPRMVPRLSSIMKFFDYVKERFVDYDTTLILAKS